MKLVTSAQMRDLEQRAVDAGTPLDELMEQAGLAVAQEVWLTLGTVAERRIVILVGPGKNGGDGLVAARYLAEWEADVIVCLLAPRPETDANYARVRELGVQLAVASEDAGVAALTRALEGAEIVIDAVLGIGRSRPIEGDMAEVLRRLREAQRGERPPKVLAVDMPTGVDADSGRVDDLAVRADMTVTFGLANVGLYMLPGAEQAGHVQVIDIGLSKDAERALPIDLLDTSWMRERLPARPLSGNKGTFGRVLVVGGSVQYVGAPRLAAEACYRAGAGLVTIACPASVQQMIAATIAEATWLPLAEDAGLVAEAAAEQIIGRLGSFEVLLIGPGLGQSAAVQSVVAKVLAAATEHHRGCVVDADALNALAAMGDAGPSQASVRARCVLTPHPGEMARLLGTTVAEVQDDRLAIAVRAAAAWKQTVVLKGAHTIVAAPDGRAAISPHANPLLASAGTGDVLAGTIAGLLAQGMEPFEAAACGVYLHGVAAEELSADFGDRGLLASDLPAAIARAARIVLRGRRPSKTGTPGLADLEAMLGPAPVDPG